MSDTQQDAKQKKISGVVAAGLKRRRRSEIIYRFTGFSAVMMGLIFLGVVFWTIISSGISAFTQTNLRLSLNFDSALIAPEGDTSRDKLMQGQYSVIIDKALSERLNLGNADSRTQTLGAQMISADSAYILRDMVVKNPKLVGQRTDVWIPADSNIDQLIKGNLPRTGPETGRLVKDAQLAWIDQLTASGDLKRHFNTALFLNGASSKPELAGIGVAVVGSFFLIGTVFLLALPLGVAAAIYLEEFAPTNVWTDLIEVNINNLAAVPSIVYGILGLAVFINFFGLPRSSAFVGGLVLTLMTLPPIIIATRASLRAVPPSIRDAALGVGASKMQAVFDHVLPLAIPGIMTGTIIGLAHALGETAPLLLIGMVAFVLAYPITPMDPTTALPVQIYLWASQPERGFVERTSAAILILLGFMLVMNAFAIILRARFERRW